MQTLGCCQPRPANDSWPHCSSFLLALHLRQAAGKPAGWGAKTLHSEQYHQDVVLASEARQFTGWTETERSRGTFRYRQLFQGRGQWQGRWARATGGGCRSSFKPSPATSHTQASSRLAGSCCPCPVKSVHSPPPAGAVHSTPPARSVCSLQGQSCHFSLRLHPCCCCCHRWGPIW